MFRVLKVFTVGVLTDFRVGCFGVWVFWWVVMFMMMTMMITSFRTA